MKFQKKLTPLVLGSCLLAAVSCGNDDDSSSSSSTPAPQPEEQSNEGTYAVTLTSLNSGVGGNAAVGVGGIIVNGDDFAVTLDMTGTPASITHAQHIHAGTACPTMAQDTNADGFVDVMEGVPVYGPILIPLDGDLSSQTAGSSGFPMSDAAGIYSYSENASLNSMLQDLMAPDPDPTDATIKLEPGEELNLEGRHFVVHGVPADVELPDTVASIGDLPSHATLPIACGVIERVSSETSEDDTTTPDGETAPEDDTTTGQTGPTPSGV